MQFKAIVFIGPQKPMRWPGLAESVITGYRKQEQFVEFVADSRRKLCAKLDRFVVNDAPAELRETLNKLRQDTGMNLVQIGEKFCSHIAVEFRL